MQSYIKVKEGNKEAENQEVRTVKVTGTNNM
jgi:hypothetical protein